MTRPSWWPRFDWNALTSGYAFLPFHEIDRWLFEATVGSSWAVG